MLSGTMTHRFSFPCRDGRALRRAAFGLAWFAAAAQPRADVFTTNVNQRLNGGAWNPIGTFRFQQGGGAEYVQLGNTGADGYVIADAALFVAGGVTSVVDDASPTDVEAEGVWTMSSATAGYHGSGYRHDQDTRGSPVKWFRFHAPYETATVAAVSLRWTAHANRASTAAVTVVHDLAPAEHDLVVSNGTGSGRHLSGTWVAIAAGAPPPGREFDRWRGATARIENPFAASTRLRMPPADTAVWPAYRVPWAGRCVREDARLIPVAATVDVAIAGASIGALGAAAQAADEGASVMLISPGFHLGTDFVGENRAWLEPGETAGPGLAQEILGPLTNAAGYQFVRPADFKRRAEQALDNRGVRFLYNLQAVDLLADATGAPAGLVAAGKGGRVAVVARVVVDATPMAGLAQQAGAAMNPWPAGATVTVSRTHYRGAAGGIVRGDHREYAIPHAFADGGWVERCRAETLLRRTFDTGAESWSAQFLHMVEPRTIVGAASDARSPWPGAGAVDPEVARPAGSAFLLVAGAACDVARDAAPAMLRPPEFLEFGRRIGSLARAIAAARPAPAGLHVMARAGGEVYPGVGTDELLEGCRPNAPAVRVPQPDRAVPIAGEYDVVVAGGGASGAFAALGAARAGASVLCVEQLGILGGTGVNGIGNFWRGYKRGVSVEYTTGSWKPNGKAAWLRSEVEAAGGEIWFNTVVCGVLREGGAARGVLVATPMGRLAVLARVVIDATGDGDVAAAAGVPTEYLDRGEFAQQDAGFHADLADPTGYQNNSWSFIDPGDPLGLTRFHVLARRHSAMADTNKWDHYPLLGSRESRRIAGGFVLTALDQYRRRTFADTIALGSSDFDNHGFFTSAACHAGLVPDGLCAIPYRALLPAGLEGLLVVGRCKSVEHDALPLSRMQSDVGNEGYAAGRAAAMAARDGIAPRHIDLAELQAHLVAVGNLPADVTLADSPAADDAELDAAAAAPDGTNEVARLLADPARALPRLRASHAAAPADSKARVLCFLGDTNGVERLAAWLDARPLGTGSSYAARSVSDVDGAIRALGFPRSPAAVPALLRKLDECTGATAFSHIRTLCVSLGEIGSPDAVPGLLRLAGSAGVTNHVRRADDGATAYVSDFRLAVREAQLAAALVRCGDEGGTGRAILTAYLDDWRSPLRRFASECLGFAVSSHGVPDAWFAGHGLDAHDEADGDGDGEPNWREFWAGSDPTARGDACGVSRARPDGTLEWAFGPGPQDLPLRIWRSLDLASGWTVLTNLPRPPGGGAWRDPDADLLDHAYYRFEFPTAP